MNVSAQVLLWGKRIGIVSQRDGVPYAEFTYDPEFIGIGIEPSPLMMGVGTGVYYFDNLSERSFHGLPGMLADSLPDKFGNAVIAAWLQAHGRRAESLSPIERLCYTGTRGMGALEYIPALLDEDDEAQVVQVDDLAALANDVLKARTDARAELHPDTTKYAPILKVGSSAGGARAKALIGWNEVTGEVRSGQVRLPEGFGYWLIKFDGLDGNGDKEGDDAKGYGRIEYAYYLMAKAAGIEMTECRLWQKRHFMTRRFDRLANGGKLHVQTLGALAHFDFNDPTAYSYEQAFRITKQVVNDARALSQQFRRMVFNVLAWNCDDHVKNISYTMDRTGEWRLAPAYDECYAYNPDGAWTSRHQMSVHGKRIGITEDDMVAAAAIADISASKARKVIGEVREAVARWWSFADEAGVKSAHADAIAARLEIPDVGSRVRFAPR